MTGASAQGRRIGVLHLILMLGETNGQYNEHCLPMIGVRDIAICTYFVPRLTPPPEIVVFAGDGTLRGFFRALRAALGGRRYDVVHAHAPESGALLVFALLLWRRFGLLRSSIVYTVQDSFHDYRLRNQALMLVTLSAFRRVIFCSRAAFDSMPGPWRWVVRRRARIVQNGADIDRVDRALAEQAVGRDDARFTVLSVGRLEPVKDPSTLLEAFARLGPEPRLVVVGAGSLERSLVGATAELGIEGRVEFTGLIPRDEVFRRCAAADVFVSTSHGEGLPVAVIEAMATGCPVVLSDIPPHREVADGADFVPLVPTGDADGFGERMRRVKELSADERAEIGRRCSDHVRARFTLPIMHAATEAVYRELPTLTRASVAAP